MASVGGAYPIPLGPDNYHDLEAIHGGVLVLAQPVEGMLDEVWPAPPPGVGSGSLLHFGFLDGESTVLADGVAVFDVSADRSTLAFPVEAGVAIQTMGGDDRPPRIASVASVPLRVNVQQEWRHIFEESWRLQRDFYWATNMAGTDWPAMRDKYAALLPRVGTRAELNDLIGEMIGELRTSHTYIVGGDEPDQASQVNVGLLGADVEWRDGGFRVARIVDTQSWSDSLRSPLAAAHLHVEPGSVLHAIDGKPLERHSNIYDILQGTAERPVTLTLSDADGNTNKRTVTVVAVADESELRYAEWVENNRQYVAQQSDGTIGYLHLPDMDAAGLVAFMRAFYPQIDRKALIVDVRNNGGGFVSQLVIQRLARKVWAFQQPRHGTANTYPRKALHGHMAVVIDQHAGSDGDIFPESFRINNLGPLVGTRTWGGVVGIRMDKPFVDLGLSSQPEFAWWEPTRGWSLENAGVLPDIEVPLTPEDRISGDDPQLDRTIELLLQKLADEPMERPTPPDVPGRN